MYAREIYHLIGMLLAEYKDTEQHVKIVTPHIQLCNQKSYAI